MTVEHRMTNDHWCTYCQGVNAHNCQFNMNVPRMKIYVTNTTAPIQRAPLTDEEIDELSRTMVKGDRSVNWLCRAIERAHGIGGDNEP